ncbi:unnamed protein product [Effrenium voratum]|uniref:Ubiquitin-like domain-containing protein n=1 Tax=Effrenium voratum TaxID=2562239 RepID=A0AA36IQI3_9DINO|nr:unnamed protein product [Effrenium voratum]
MPSPSLVFVKNDEGILIPAFVNTSDTISSSKVWSPTSSDDFMVLTQKELRTLVPPHITISQPINKKKLCETIFSKWGMIVDYKNQSETCYKDTSTAQKVGSSGMGGGGGGDPHGDSSDEDSDNNEDSDGFEENEGEFDLETFSEKFFDIYVKSGFSQSPSIMVSINPSWKVRSLDFTVSAKMKVPMSALRYTTQKGDNVYKTLSFKDNRIQARQTIIVMLELKGGVGRKVVKPQLKENEVKARFIAKSKETIKPFLDAYEVDSNVTPAELTPLLQPLTSKVADIKRRVALGEDALIDGLMFLSDEQLETLSTIFAVKKGKFTEQKLVQASYAIIPEMKLVDEYVGHLTKHKNIAVTDFLETYATTFVQSRSGDLTYDNDRFAEAVKTTIAYRKGIRRASEVANAQPNEVEDNSTRCVLM